MAISANDSHWNKISEGNGHERVYPKVPGIAAGNLGAGQGVTVGNSRTSTKQKIKAGQSCSDSRFQGTGPVPFTGRIGEAWETGLTDLTASDKLRSIATECPPATKSEQELCDAARYLASGTGDAELAGIIRAELVSHLLTAEARATATDRSIRQCEIIREALSI